MNLPQASHGLDRLTIKLKGYFMMVSKKVDAEKTCSGSGGLFESGRLRGCTTHGG